MPAPNITIQAKALLKQKDNQIKVQQTIPQVREKTDEETSVKETSSNSCGILDN